MKPELSVNTEAGVRYSRRRTRAEVIGFWSEYSNLTGANVTRANLQSIDLSLTTLTGVISSGITGTPYRLPDGWTLIGGVLVGP